MKRFLVALSVLASAGMAVPVLAVGPGQTLTFTGSPQGKVVFDGTAHKNAGLTCSDCHNAELFPKMKKGTVKITMAEMKAGKYCGRCHNGKRAFTINECSKCHHPEAPK